MIGVAVQPRLALFFVIRTKFEMRGINGGAESACEDRSKFW